MVKEIIYCIVAFIFAIFILVDIKSNTIWEAISLFGAGICGFSMVSYAIEQQKIFAAIAICFCLFMFYSAKMLSILKDIIIKKFEELKKLIKEEKNND